MYRHIRFQCKYSNNDDTEQRLAAQDARIDSLASIVEKMSTICVTAGPVINTTNNVINNVITNNNVNINIHPWDGDNRINTNAERISASFNENDHLKEYLLLDDDQRTDPTIAPPYVETFLVDQTRRAHEDMTLQNVYLNPNRADQAMVLLKDGRWGALPLAEVVRSLNDHLMKVVLRVAQTPDELQKLTLDVQNAIGIMCMLYDCEPDDYMKRVKAAAAAHLKNMTTTVDIRQHK